MLMIIGFSILIGIGLSLYFDGWHSIGSLKKIFRNIISSIILGGTLWFGNYFIADYFNRTKAWITNPKWGIFKHVTIALSFSISVMVLFYIYIWFVRLGQTSFKNFFDYFKFSFFVFTSITAVITLFFYSKGFFQAWKQSLVNQERLKRESIVLQYEAFKNQINPHFLFNSLNVLTSLIEKDSKASVNYVKQLSEVFRYVLDQNSTEQVHISEELKFIESYIYLNKIRFGENLKVNINIEDDNFRLIPVSLQILIENAIKHNEISNEHPLNIEIREENDYLMIKNNLQPRNYLPESNQIGLHNLKFQYEFLTGKSLEIIHNSDFFIVKLPKIK